MSRMQEKGVQHREELIAWIISQESQLKERAPDTEPIQIFAEGQQPRMSLDPSKFMLQVIPVGCLSSV